ncbi:3-dehydroquinate synthase [Flavobacterium sp.]|uniref:3-dehydroquinate synthase n=1 Tax=Flavobacterium sp. TaxID=239 RepID=UPI003B9B057F
MTLLNHTALVHDIYEGENGYAALNALIEKKKYSKIVLFSDEVVYDLWASKLLQELYAAQDIHTIVIEAGEEQKQLEICRFIYEELADIEADKSTLMINFGGGVVTDIGGFIASTFKRGIDFVNVPTTLLGMVDAALGGKNGIDLGPVKNQIGTTAMPQLVLIDCAFAESLESEEILSGLAEMIKHGAIADAAVFERFEQATSFSITADSDSIIESAQIKMRIVSEDPFENGLRKVLNFGHSIGHALESYLLENSEERVYHGYCVAAGMIMESHMAWQNGLLAETDFNRLVAVIDRFFDRIIIPQNAVPKLLELMRHDKKNRDGNLRYAPITAIGFAKDTYVADSQQIENAIQFYNS